MEIYREMKKVSIVRLEICVQLQTKSVKQIWGKARNSLTCQH